MLSNRVLMIARSQRAGYAMRSLQRAKFHSSRLILAETVKVPQMAESISEGTLKSWSKKVGESVEADEEVATIETDKIDVTVNAPSAGKITELLANEEDTVSVGQDLFRFEAGAAGESASSESSESKQESSPPKEKEESKPAPPKEEKKEKKPSPPPASPPKEEKKKESPPSAPKKKEENKSKGESAAMSVGNRNETRVKLSRMRLRIAERLKQSQNTAASLTTFNEIDMSALIALRQKYKEPILSSTGVKLGFMGLFAKAACLALRAVPGANASIEGDEMVYRDFVDLSVAVATEKGLVTPVVRGCEAMDVVEIERSISELGKKARDGKLGLEDMNGGTFTISNGGVFGSLYGTPILNLPQAAVLGMHAIKDKAVVVDGQIVVRPIMVVALTYDHRILDGREGVTFLVKLKEYLEDPLRMLLG